MNRTKLKNYAPQARREFIQAVTDRAAYYGLTAKHIEPITEKGDVAIIAGKAFPRAMAQKRKALEERIARQGFEQTMEAMAYTWFNRLVAIRFVELHGYLDHGYRVLSHPEGKATPEILEHAEHVDLPGLDKSTVIDLKLDGSKEAELYRLLLIAQCNALHAAMPFLFERIDDETELLLPDNLLHSDSLMRKLVNEIDEEDWQEVEIIGWLYESYIAEKHREVIGKVVKSEDIPAATQLFTPNWIVKYLVQNSLGRQWLATYPHSPLRQQMEYYIEPAEQTPEVQAQLKAITPESLNPEELTLLDPACGSGHILVEAYDLFKAIYQERGYRARDIPTLILQKNLFGLEIDDRAAQLAAFALVMKARADNRRIFSSGVQPHVLAIQESKGLNAKELVKALNTPVVLKPLPPSDEFEFMQEIRQPLFTKERMAVKGDLAEEDVAVLVDLFTVAKTFGSLIQVPPQLAEKLPAIEKRVRDVLAHGDLMMQPAAKVLLPLIEQVWMLSRQYDAVVANPPYMGAKVFNEKLKTFTEDRFPNGKFDLFACFMLRAIDSCNPNGFFSMITPPNWMFHTTAEDLRRAILGKCSLESLIHNGRGIFGSDFGSCAFSFCNRLTHTKGVFRKLFEIQGSVATQEELRQRFFTQRSFVVQSSSFSTVPGIPVAYWASEQLLSLFSQFKHVEEVAEPRQGLATADNERFLRLWHEVSIVNIGFNLGSRDESVASQKRWFPIAKGGEFRKWYGNQEWVVDWFRDGAELFAMRPKAVIRNPDKYFKECVSWSRVTIGGFSLRFVPKGFVFDATGPAVFCEDRRVLKAIALVCNSVLGKALLEVLSPLVNYEVGHVAKIPIAPDLLSLSGDSEQRFDSLIGLAKADWDSSEQSWGFESTPFLTDKLKCVTVKETFRRWEKHCVGQIRAMQQFETENNQSVIKAYGLNGALSAQVSEDQITLARPDREEDIKRLISYTIGCMMGRYSLDKPGLIYAQSGNKNFDPSQYTTFPADPDGIVPIMEVDWFPDDAANRFVEFISVAWPDPSPQPSSQRSEGALLEENLKFVADSLGPNKGEQPRDAIRRYLATGFFKDHLRTYKRRPIYWLFSSGKQRAFQCLVYLHRYNEGTLSRMRTEYVIPLRGKIAARIDHLASDIQQATSTSHRKKLERERDTLLKQQSELQAFDEKLRHYADQRISLDLDDGVKVNYGKFGDLLAEVKAVCGKEED